jgi:hypothetical protein
MGELVALSAIMKEGEETYDSLRKRLGFVCADATTLGGGKCYNPHNDPGLSGGRAQWRNAGNPIQQVSRELRFRGHVTTINL